MFSRALRSELFHSWDLLFLLSLFTAVASVIDENIKLCRRLIIIIVPESLGFDLLKNMSEEQIAIYNALIQDGMKVILIEVEKIKNYTVMPESIQYIKQKHGSVHWNGDFTEESLCAKTKFWKKVRYCMPPKRFPPSSHAQLLKHMPCDLTAGNWYASAGLFTLWCNSSAGSGSHLDKRHCIQAICLKIVIVYLCEELCLFWSDILLWRKISALKKALIDLMSLNTYEYLLNID